MAGPKGSRQESGTVVGKEQARALRSLTDVKEEPAKRSEHPVDRAGTASARSMTP
jgi:hypothetical protein